MTKPADIAWGRYKQYEGPFYRGSTRYSLPANPTDQDKVLAVFTATEGGRYDAINAYDRCIISVGLIQWCEAKYFLTSKLLGAMAESDVGLLRPLAPVLQDSNADFYKSPQGRWRFRFKDARGEVDTAKEQEALFLLCNGLRGSWTEEAKAHAKHWAACMSDCLAQPGAVAIQNDYTVARVRAFAMKESRKILFDGAPAPEGWVGAIQAAFLSFAGNLPAVANKHLQIAVSKTKAAKWSEDWCVTILKELTFGPQIAIYPHRYNAIRKTLEALYGVDVPDAADELKTWTSGMGLDPKTAWDRILDDDLYEQDEPTFTTAKEVQSFLIEMGYDLGPSGADGRLGPKSKDAIMTFQRTHGLEDDGVVGPKTRATLLEAWKAKA